MNKGRKFETLAGAALGAAFLLTVALIAVPHVAVDLGEADAAAINETRTRLARLAAVRGGAVAAGRDERFDALLASLEAGQDAPDALGPALDRIVAARDRERAVVVDDRSRVARQAVPVPSEVDDAIAAAALACDELGRQPSPMKTVLAVTTAVLPWAIGAFILVGMVATASARRTRRASLEAIAGVLGCDVHEATGAELAGSVHRHVDIACEAAVARALERAGKPVGAARPAVLATRASAAVAPVYAEHHEPHVDPASAVRARVESADDLDTGDYDLDTPIPGCDSFRIAEIKALPLDDLPSSVLGVKD